MIDLSDRDLESSFNSYHNATDKNCPFPFSLATADATLLDCATVLLLLLAVCQQKGRSRV